MSWEPLQWESRNVSAISHPQGYYLRTFEFHALRWDANLTACSSNINFLQLLIKDWDFQHQESWFPADQPVMKPVHFPGISAGLAHAWSPTLTRYQVQQDFAAGILNNVQYCDRRASGLRDIISRNHPYAGIQNVSCSSLISNDTFIMRNKRNNFCPCPSRDITKCNCCWKCN